MIFGNTHMFFSFFYSNSDGRHRNRCNSRGSNRGFFDFSQTKTHVQMGEIYSFSHNHGSRKI